MSKYCGGCKQTLRLTSFARNKVHKDGLQTRCRACMSKWRAGDKPIRIYAVRESARKRALTCSLTDQEILDMIQSPCEYCGDAPAPFNGIDRIDSALGYTPENTTACCKFCNFGKNTRTKEEFETWVLRAAEHLKLARQKAA